MALFSRHRTIECKTIDGITLEGWFYEVEGPAPAIIMTHGVRVSDSIFNTKTDKLSAELRQGNES